MLSSALLVALMVPSVEGSKVHFSRDVLPILSDHCFSCHGPDEKARKAKLRLDTKAGAYGKSKNPGNEIVKPNDPSHSELFQRLVTTDPKEIMPPASTGRKITKNQIDTIRQWIEEGANWGNHWAFDPPVKSSLPKTPAGTRAANAIDSLILDSLSREGLKQSPRANAEILVRRLYLDLTGLPPTRIQAQEFLSDASPAAYSKLVDQLLASPHFGERMVWDWLEASRYADSNGYQGDTERTMWPWRDWVISAFNDNMPFDQFTIWQLAGDLLPNASFEQRLATGFNRNHMINGEGGRIAAENRVDYVMDMTETMGTIWMALTFNCSRCHDHKYDPITQKDYYQLFSFFNNTPVDGSGRSGQTAPVLEAAKPQDRLKKKELDSLVGLQQKALEDLEQVLFPREKGKKASDSANAAKFPKELLEILAKPSGSRGKAQLQQLAKGIEKSNTEHLKAVNALIKAIDERDNFAKTFPLVMVMEELPKPRESYILEVGNYEKPTTKVGTAVPAVLPPMDSSLPVNRFGLATWLVSGQNPLTSRVIVNRVWQQFFGAGLVKSSEDFGVQGEKPSHPELLDWLAVEFQQSGWDIKHVIRLIVSSETYQQSSRLEPDTLEKDSANKYLSHGPRFRRPAWMIRDQALAASELLVRHIGGPPTRPYQPSGIWEEATFGNKKYAQDSGENLYKRSVYTFWRRIIGPTMFFDTPARQYCNVKPTRTNTPLHALATLNDITYVEAARMIAENALKSHPQDDSASLQKIFQSILVRLPSDEESGILRKALQQYLEAFEKDSEAAKKFISVGEKPADKTLDSKKLAALGTLALSILNLDEALNKE
ncbi:MAG: PSD1 and planctomycete cytochrome C domain-containing protein [Gemmataceae bacterium]